MMYRPFVRHERLSKIHLVSKAMIVCELILFQFQRFYSARIIGLNIKLTQDLCLLSLVMKCSLLVSRPRRFFSGDTGMCSITTILYYTPILRYRHDKAAVFCSKVIRLGFN